jgi:hypothetical protein
MSILFCQCGARIHAPNARPGRRGRCPQCGSTLIVPDGPPPLEPVDLPRAEPSVAASAGYGVAADEAEISSYSSRKHRRSVRTKRRQEESEAALFLEKGRTDRAADES